MALVTLNRVGLLALTLPTNLEQQCIRLQRELYARLGDSSFLLLPPLLPLLLSEQPVGLEAVRSLARTERLNLSLEGALPFREAGAVWLPAHFRLGSGLQALFERAATLASPLENAPIPQRGEILLGGMEGNGELSLDDLPTFNGSSSTLTIASYELLYRENEGWWRHCNYFLRAKGRLGAG